MSNSVDPDQLASEEKRGCCGVCVCVCVCGGGGGGGGFEIPCMIGFTADPAMTERLKSLL